MDQTEAARAVLIEVSQILGAFKDNIVIVGGWVPDLWYSDKNHVGSLDVDLAVSPEARGSDAYSTILGRLKEKGYSHAIQPTRFLRIVEGVSEPIKIDFISGQYVNDEKKDKVIVDELGLNTLRGIDLAFEMNEEIAIEGIMPDGSHNIVHPRIVRPEAFILIKAFALADRMKPKDAYDIAFVLHHYEPEISVLASYLQPIIRDGLGAEALQILIEKFATLESVGPTWAGNVAEENGINRDQSLQAAFQDAQTLFNEIEKLID